MFKSDKNINILESKIRRSPLAPWTFNAEDENFPPLRTTLTQDIPTSAFAADLDAVFAQERGEDAVAFLKLMPE